MKSVKEASIQKGMYVLVRTDFNVPIQDGHIASTMRIRASYETISYLKEKGARVILISHIGRDPNETLLPVATLLQETFPVTFAKTVEEALAHKKEMHDGDILLIENLRRDPREEENDQMFAQELASLGDIYVNEAFPVSHREAASIVGIPKYKPGYMGLWFEKEVEMLGEALTPTNPFLFILGGAKTETKIPLLKRYLEKADYVFLGGVVANTLLKERGFGVGVSTVDAVHEDIHELFQSEKIILPMTVVTESGVRDRDAVGSTEKIVDIGLESIDKLLPFIQTAKLIVWNGPLGWYEGGYEEGTNLLLDALIKTDATVIIGGGDTAVLVEQKNMVDKFSFVSTGGGATLEYLATGTLVGIEALSQK